MLQYDGPLRGGRWRDPRSGERGYPSNRHECLPHRVFPSVGPPSRDSVHPATASRCNECYSRNAVDCAAAGPSGVRRKGRLCARRRRAPCPIRPCSGRPRPWRAARRRRSRRGRPAPARWRPRSCRAPPASQSGAPSRSRAPTAVPVRRLWPLRRRWRVSRRSISPADIPLAIISRFRSSSCCLTRICCRLVSRNPIRPNSSSPPTVGRRMHRTPSVPLSIRLSSSAMIGPSRWVQPGGCSLTGDDYCHGRAGLPANSGGRPILPGFPLP